MYVHTYEHIFNISLFLSLRPIRIEIKSVIKNYITNEQWVNNIYNVLKKIRICTQHGNSSRDDLPDFSYNSETKDDVFNFKPLLTNISCFLSFRRDRGSFSTVPAKNASLRYSPVI